jgi:hypothetical protein
LETRYFTSAAPRLTCSEHFSRAICYVRVVTSQILMATRFVVMIRLLASLFYVQVRLTHFIPLYSHCYTLTCFSPQKTILRKY